MMSLTKRQRRILDFVRDFTERRGYAPTLHEIGRHFGLRSPATVHKHLRNLEERGALKRQWNHSRAIEVLPEAGSSRAFLLPLEGVIERGRPLELHAIEENVPVPAGLLGTGRTYALRVRGPGFRDVLIADGDLVILEDLADPPAAGLALVLLRGNEPVIKSVRREGDRLTLEPADEPGEPVWLEAHQARIRARVLGVLRKY